MAAFVRLTAVLVGLANMFLFSLAGDGELGNAFILNLDPWWPDNFLYAIYAVFAGLLTASIILKFANRTLHGDFAARYGVMLLALVLGGVLLGVIPTLIANLFDDHLLTVTKKISWVLSMAPLAAVTGGILGALEGVFLAFPLAAILICFRIAG